MNPHAETLLTLFLTLLPGHPVTEARELARTTLERAGCADVRVEMHKSGAPTAPLSARAWCRKLGPPPKEEALP